MSRQQRRAVASSALPITSFVIIISNVIACTLSMNELCPGQCECEDEFLRAACVFTNLEVVPIQLNPEIQHLDLSNNKIDSLTLAFAFYDNLLDLDISSNILQTLGSENFLLQERLIKLNVSNNGITTVSKCALKGLRSLTIIDLSHNNISEIDSQAFRYTNELQYIDISGNSLLNLPNGLLKNLHRIETLNLSRNSLLQVPKSNLELVPSLESLDLSENLILKINHDSIPFLRSLIALNLANNVIRSISDSAFERLPALLNLNLEGNNLIRVPTYSLARLNVLSHLLLSRNPLKTLESLAFRNLFELRILDLRQCELTSINQSAFDDNINLEYILLDGNHKLQYLPPRVLHNARYLKSVSLRYCKLSSLEPTHFPIDDLKVLRVGGNPFACNCSLHWLWHVIYTQERRNTSKLWVDSDKIICNDSEFSGKLLMHLAEHSLSCRLSTFYLTLLVVCCLIATATILVLAAWITQVQRRKHLSFALRNRRELFVYIGPSQNESSKHSMGRQHSCVKQLTQSNNVGKYDSSGPQNGGNTLENSDHFHNHEKSKASDLYNRNQGECKSVKILDSGEITDLGVFHGGLDRGNNSQIDISHNDAVSNVGAMSKNDRIPRLRCTDHKSNDGRIITHIETPHIVFV